MHVDNLQTALEKPRRPGSVGVRNWPVSSTPPPDPPTPRLSISVAFDQQVGCDPPAGRFRHTEGAKLTLHERFELDVWVWLAVCLTQALA